MSLREDLKRLVGEKDFMLIGKVTAVHEDVLSVDVQPERPDTAELKNVPIRVMNLSDDLGIYVVPRVGTQVLVGLVDGRPTAFQFQEWERVVMKRADGFYLEVKRNGDVVLETSGNVELKAGGRVQLGQNGQYSAVWGEVLRNWLMNHTHPTPSGPSGPPSPPPPNFLSSKVKLD